MRHTGHKGRWDVSGEDVESLRQLSAVYPSSARASSVSRIMLSDKHSASPSPLPLDSERGEYAQSQYRLERSTVVQSQLEGTQPLPLLPPPLSPPSTPSPFRANGFEFVVDESKPVGQRFRLCSVPFSRNVMLGVEGEGG